MFLYESYIETERENESNETSAADRNSDIMSALEGRDHELFNVGMKKNGEKPEILYSMRYPGVFCGHILTALDAWLFTQINGGNCISLALNQGYGWAADISLRFIFDRIFSVEQGCGYPPHRKEPQQAARQTLKQISSLVHRSFAEIIGTLPETVIMPALECPGFIDLVDVASIQDEGLKQAFSKRIG